MSQIAGTLEIQILTNLARLTDDMSKVKGIIGSTMKSVTDSVQAFKTVLGSIGGGLTFAEIYKEALSAAKEFEMQQARLKGVLQATGYAAGVTSKELNEMGESLADVTKFDKESITQAQANILKFGNITQPVFERTLKLSADMAALMGTDLPTAANMLGKALQSPTEGLKGLTKEFGKLTPEQTAHIELLVKQGKALEAQAAILDLVEGRVGGLAETMNTGLNKATSDVAKAWHELLEEMGKSDAIGGSAERKLNGLSLVLRDLRKELEGERTPLSTLVVDLANAFIYWQTLGFGGSVEGEQSGHNVFGSIPRPTIGSKSPVDEATRLRKWQQDFDEQQRAWAAMGNVTLGGKIKADPEALAEMRLFTNALQRYEEELGRANNMSTAEKAIYELTVGSLSKLTMEHKAAILAVAGEVDERKQLIAVIDANTKHYLELYEAEQKQLQIQREFRQSGLDAIDDLKFQNDLLDKTALEIVQLTEARRIDIAARTAERAIAEAAGDDYEAYIANVKKLREETQRQKDVTAALVQQNYELARSFDVGLAKAINDYVESSTNMAANVNQVFNTVFHGAEDVFVNFVRTGKLEFKQFADSVIADIARIYFRLSVSAPIAQGLQQYSSGGGLGAALLSFLGLGGSSSYSSGPAGKVDTSYMAVLGGYASGTDYVPRTGPYLLHQGERVINSQDNARWGGEVIIQNKIDARGADAGVEQRIEAAMEKVKRSIVPIVADAKRRNAFGRVL